MARGKRTEETSTDTTLDESVGTGTQGSASDEDKETLRREDFFKLYGYYLDNETASQKFARLAVGRMSRIIDGIRSLPTLANRKVYEYSEEHAEKMFATLQTELSNAREKFGRVAQDGAGKQRTFTFGS